jgi:hypothetical protein
MIYGVRTLHYETPQGREAAKGRVFIPEQWKRWMDGWMDELRE